MLQQLFFFFFLVTKFILLGTYSCLPVSNCLGCFCGCYICVFLLLLVGCYFIYIYVYIFFPTPKISFQTHIGQKSGEGAGKDL